MLIRKGRRGVVVVLNEGKFEVGIPFSEVVRLMERLWPWELGEHVVLNGDEAHFKDMIPFERVLIYLLARRGGLLPRDAEALASYLRLHEVVALSETFLYRFWLCKVSDNDCRRLTDVFSRIIANYRRVLP
ncbi:hypothetical protein [Vulcanisaeta souniana]|uniref:Uncharacterized protein n=1 Tax=Vulcanisaeta souniana JCM 11219 TaxID=1293586 RepID=A0A830E3Y1_9CREN|nr:hypothetical protein [Vulcanisaeta souniana]BDR91068.1 hypothetical protein Vsou_01610 [Vulcanisaeta souniana JCM 11219]GGI80554.1 hypothetical protein GCM10007112_16720 [Vulcanisaeta souniana JCM 11219]